MRRGAETHTRLYSHAGAGILRARRVESARASSGLSCRRGARPARPAPDLRHRQGRRRQVDGRDRARLLAARRGLRTIVAELVQPGPRCQRLFEPANGEHFDELELAPGLFTISVDPQHAMEEYLRVKVGAVGQRCSARAGCSTPSRWRPRGCASCSASARSGSSPSSSAGPSGAAPYDLVIVDAPATGHGVGLLRTPRTFAEIARVGPIAHQGRTIAADDRRPRFTARGRGRTPEEMPVNETLALRDALAGDGLALDSR